MSDEWIATEWQRRADVESMNSSPVTITRMRSPSYDGERFAVRNGSACLNSSGEWEYEPMPSSRDDAFYARCRFPDRIAAMAALAIAERPR